MDLRKSRWTLKRGGGQTGPTTIAQIHQEAKKASEEKEKETMKRSGSSQRIFKQRDKNKIKTNKNNKTLNIVKILFYMNLC